MIDEPRGKPHLFGIVSLPEKPDAPTPRYPSEAPEFERFWSLYPRKEAKGYARMAWRRAIARASPDDILAALERQAPMLLRRERRFIPHPARWLAGERWLDEPDGAP